MQILDYVTNAGKNVIKEYLSHLPKNEMDEGYSIRHEIILNGIVALNSLNTRQLKGKLYEIKFSKNRIMYILKDEETIYFLHACRKQKGKAEQFELNTAIKRAKESGFKL